MSTKNEETVAEEAVLSATLIAAGKKAEAAKAAKRERDVRGSHLLDSMVKRAESAGLTITEKSGFFMISGPQKGRRIYVAKKGGRADLSGFTVDKTAVKQVTEAEAKSKHLGKVRGHLDFEKGDEEVLAAYQAALELVAEPVETKAVENLNIENQ